jgi:hypothetical protein
VSDLAGAGGRAGSRNFLLEVSTRNDTLPPSMTSHPRRPARPLAILDRVFVISTSVLLLIAFGYFVVPLIWDMAYQFLVFLFGDYAPSRRP